MAQPASPGQRQINDRVQCQHANDIRERKRIIHAHGLSNVAPLNPVASGFIAGKKLCPKRLQPRQKRKAAETDDHRLNTCKGTSGQRQTILTMPVVETMQAAFFIVNDKVA
jgi:hypothetical protein